MLEPAPTRRNFLKGATASAVGLSIGFHWVSGGGRLAAAPVSGGFAPNAFVRIDADGIVTVVIKHLEMGQGVTTGLTTILAEELDADWDRIRVEFAPADASRYNNLSFGKMQGTGGSTAIANSWEQLRKAGATARTLLVRAAAAEWRVPETAITVERGVLSHAASGRKAGFGAFAAKAGALPVPGPDTVALKDPANYKLIGKQVPRLDSKDKTDGTARFALDVKLDKMVTALVLRPPLFGAKLVSFEAEAAKAVPGVLAVFAIPPGIAAPGLAAHGVAGGVAVVARDFWSAQRGRDAIKAMWDDSLAEKRSTPAIFAAYEELAKKPGLPARRNGDPDTALDKAASRVSAIFRFPYLAHAPMEPLDCVVRLTGNSCEIWAGDQFQTVDQMNAATAAGLKPEQVEIHTLYAGGSFGRRANTVSDYIVEAVTIAKKLGTDGVPVKLVWTREDDIKGGRYRPMYLHALEGGLDRAGHPVAWRHRIVGQSIGAGTPMAKQFIENGIDKTSVEGAVTLPYAIPDLSVDLHSTETGVPVLWWRSVGSTHNAYATEAFLDFMAASGGKDPVALRRALLASEPRYLGVLNLAAEKSGWGHPLPKGREGQSRGRGVAVQRAFGTYVAQVAEVTVRKDGFIRVDRVVCAVDCGIAVNPGVIAAQMEGGIGFGLSAVLHGAVTLKDGKVEQSNFHDYRVLRIDEMPVVEVHIVPSAQAPTGVGEPGVPPIGPAVANAVFAATGRRLTDLPFQVS